MPSSEKAPPRTDVVPLMPLTEMPFAVVLAKSALMSTRVAPAARRTGRDHAVVGLHHGLHGDDLGGGKHGRIGQRTLQGAAQDERDVREAELVDEVAGLDAEQRAQVRDGYAGLRGNLREHAGSRLQVRHGRHVRNVRDDEVRARVGLQVGDQLLILAR